MEKQPLTIDEIIPGWIRAGRAQGMSDAEIVEHSNAPGNRKVHDRLMELEAEEKANV